MLITEYTTRAIVITTTHVVCGLGQTSPLGIGSLDITVDVIGKCIGNPTVTQSERPNVSIDNSSHRVEGEFFFLTPATSRTKRILNQHDGHVHEFVHLGVVVVLRRHVTVVGLAQIVIAGAVTDVIDGALIYEITDIAHCMLQLD
ncbi:hypothetical protein D3C86_1433220 [compost metagenome]